jgi:hypothetical protein
MLLCFTISPNTINITWLIALLAYACFCYFIGGLHNDSSNKKLMVNSMIAFIFQIIMSVAAMKGMSYDILAEIEKRIQV